MTVRPEVVRRKLLEIEHAAGHLRSWLPITPDRLEDDQQLLWAVERGLQVAAEAVFDAGAHILSAEFQETADEYKQIPQKLAARGVIAPDTAGRLKGLAGFRNILVHEYADIELDRLCAGLDRLDDFEAFVADVERWLRATGR